MKLRKDIYQDIERIVEDFGYLLVDLNIRGDNRKRIIEVFVDNESGVSADDCAEISRKIDSGLDLAEIAGANHRLDVSSPGTDRPLKFLRQFPKHMNRKFEIQYREGENTRKLKGELTGIEDNHLTFVSGKESITLDFDTIISAKVLISF